MFELFNPTQKQCLFKHRERYVSVSWEATIASILSANLLSGTGLARGSADLIGLRTVTITPEMVGQQVAVFTSIEVKTAKGRATAEQQNWLHMVRSLGGIAGIARSVRDAENLLDS